MNLSEIFIRRPVMTMLVNLESRSICQRCAGCHLWDGWTTARCSKIKVGKDWPEFQQNKDLLWLFLKNKLHQYK